MTTIERLLDLEGDAERLTAKIRAAIQAERGKPVVVIPVPNPKPPAGIDPADLQNEINELRPGDTLTVAPGALYGAVEIRDKPGVTIRAAVPGETRISGLWEAADRGEVRWLRKWGAWAADHGDSFMGSAGEDFLFRYGGDRPVDLLKADTILGRYKKPFHGYAWNHGQIFVRLPDDADPNGISIKLCDKPAQNIVRVINSPDVTLDGFQVEGAGDADAVICDAKSEAVAMRNCVVTHSRRAARLPHESLVEWCEFSYPGLWRFYQQLVDLNGPGTAALFDMAKKHWLSQRGGAAIEGGFGETIYEAGSRGCEFRSNYYHNTFDGQQLGAFPGANSHRNIYRRNVDNHFQMEHWSKKVSTSNIHEHHSLLLDCPAGPVSHQDSSGGMLGPHYVSHSIIANREVSSPFMIKLLGLKGDVVYAHCEFDLKAGPDQEWGAINRLAQGMKGQDVPSWLRVYNTVIRGDEQTPIQGSPVMKGIAGTRGMVEAVDMPADWPIERHAFIGPNVPDDLTDWPRPMRRAFSR